MLVHFSLSLSLFIHVSISSGEKNLVSSYCASFLKVLGKRVGWKNWTMFKEEKPFLYIGISLCLSLHICINMWIYKLLLVETPLKKLIFWSSNPQYLGMTLFGNEIMADIRVWYTHIAVERVSSPPLYC